MDQRSISSQFFFGVLVEVSLAVLIFVWAALNCQGSRLFIFCAISFYIVVFNVGSYWGAVCQAANETHLFSKMQIIDKTGFFVLLLVGIFMSIPSCEYYVVAYIASRLVADCYIVSKCKCFFGRSIQLIKEAFHESVLSIKVGIKLTISYIAGIFILGAPRMVADGAWNIEQFAQLSFSISLMNFFVVFINQVGMVLFPALKQVSFSKFEDIYRKITKSLDLFTPSVYILYYPVLVAVQWWLPQYTEGLQWLSLMLPVCVYNSRMEILSSTALKVLRRESVLMRVNVTAACLVMLLSLGCVLFRLNHWALVLSIVFVTMGRSVVSELYVSRIIGHMNVSSVVVTFFFAVQYLVITITVNVMTAVLISVVLWLIILVLERKTISSFLRIKKLTNI